MSRRSTGAVVSYIYSGAQIVVNLLYVPILLATIGRAEYGLYQMVGSIMAYLGIMNTTLSAGATRYYCKSFALGDQDGMANVLGTLRRLYRKANIVIVVAMGVLSVAVRVVYADSLSTWELNESTLLLVILCINMLFTINNTLSIAVITAHERFAFLKGTQLAMILLQPVLVVVLIQQWPYAWVVCTAVLLCNAMCRTVQHTYAKRHLGMDDRLRQYDAALERDLLRFSSGIVLAAIADQIFWRTDQLILGWMYGTEVVAVYSVGSQVITAYTPLGMTVSTVFLPKASEIWNREKSKRGLSDLFIRVGRLSLYPLLLVMTGFMVFGADFVRLWAGAGFEDAFWVALIVMVPFTVDICQNIGLTVLQVLDMYGFRGKVFLFAAVLNIGLTFVLARLYGCVGASVSSAVALFASSGLIMNWYYWKRVGLDVPLFWKSVLRMCLPIAALCLGASLLWNAAVAQPGWIQLFTGISLYVLAFASVSWFTVLNQYEKGLVTSLFSKLQSRSSGA